ncbi:MAG: hypothetical protein IJB32_01125 [Clostridia bacterium]|nr:hypothetical protein [Clostridia bacterium]
MEVVLIVLGVIVGIAILIAIGVLCGRISVDIIRERKSEQNEVLWFWLGFVFNVTAILLAIVLRFAKDKE